MNRITSIYGLYVGSKRIISSCMMFGVETVVASGLGLFVCFWIWQRKGRQSSRPGLKQVPGPSGWPIVGNLIDPKKFHTLFTKWMEEYGELFQINLFGNRMIMINNSKLFRDMSEKMTDRLFNFSGFAVFLAYNTYGLTWSSIKGNQPLVRDMFVKAMHEIDENNVKELVDEETKRFVRELEELGNDFDFKGILHESVARQFAIMLTGKKASARVSCAILEYAKMADTLYEGGLVFLLTKLPWLRFVPWTPFKRVYHEFDKAMKTATNVLTDEASKNEKRTGVINRMLEIQKITNDEAGEMCITEGDIRACIKDFVGGGLGPIKDYITATILCLLHKPEVQEKIHNEMVNARKEERLPFLEATILESWRFNSIVATTLPHFASEDTEIGGYFIPKGTSVFGNIYNLHHDEKTWGDPWEFRPERWLADSGKILPDGHPLQRSLMPFGTGIRACKGQTMSKSSVYQYLSAVLSHFKVCPPVDLRIPNNDPRTFEYGAALFLPEFRCCVVRRDR